MAKPRGHVSLNGKDYIIVDGSYQSKMVPLFRPQLQIEGISHEALDQYLYWVQETWNRVTNKDALLGVWKDGGYRTINGLDNSDDGKLKLQPATSLCLSKTGNGGILLAYGSDLYLFSPDGTVQRSAGGCVWTAVTYDPNGAGLVTPPAPTEPREPWELDLPERSNDSPLGGGSGGGGSSGGKVQLM